MKREVPFEDERRRLFGRLDDKYQLAVRLALDMSPEGVRDNYDVDGPLGGALDYLPLFDRDHARAIFNAFVSSPEEDDRMTLVHGISDIVKKDKEYGLPLWHRLMGDPSRTVRRYAYETLTELWDDGAAVPGPDYSRVYDSGITWREGSHLLRTYVEAEVEGRRYRLGTVVLSSEIEPVPPGESDPQPPSAGSTAI
jgi:hypothetical protein